MQKRIITIGIYILVMALVSCNKDNPVNANQLPASLSGTVVDAQGHPIQNAKVNYIPDLLYTSPLPSNAKNLSSLGTVNFFVQTTSYVNISLYRWFTRSLVETLYDGTAVAGYHTVAYDTTIITSGVYLLDAKIDTLTVERRMLVVRDTSALHSVTPLAITDSQGKFSIPIGVFGIGLSFPISSSTSPSIIDTATISDSVSIIVSKPGYQTLIEQAILDTTQSLSQKFTLTQ